jgi:hypothetical protein
MKLQLAFLVDCTLSMKTYIDNLVACLETVIDKAIDENPEWTVECALIGYRDFFDPIGPTIDFKKNIRAVRDALSTIEALGGRDTCEDVHSGLIRTAHLSWDRFAASKVIFHIADGPAHGIKYHAPDVEDDYPNISNDLCDIMTEDLAMRDIHYTLGRINYTTDIMSDLFRDAYVKCVQFGSLARFSELPVTTSSEMETALYKTISLRMSLPNL